jgi:3-hydroxyacyl-CoA dehydrogenase
VPRGLLTSDETVERVEALINSFGKVPVVLKKDVPGFVANRFLMPMLIEAARLLEEGVASKEEIDLLVKKGIGIPFSVYTRASAAIPRLADRRRARGALRAGTKELDTTRVRCAFALC